MKSPYDVILRPIITEKSMSEVGNKKYVFEVARDANKIEIRRAVEEIFKVKVTDVNTISVKGKEKRQNRTSGYTAARKKAVVRLSEDSKPIEVFEGMV